MTTAQVWFITGCSSGFGAAITRSALARGDKVIATARNASKLKDLKAEGADILDFDVTAPLPELKKKAEQAFNLYGRIDYVINNAGYTQVGGLEELTPEDDLAQFNTNVFGLLNTTRAFLPYLRGARSGAIANISSIGAWSGAAGVGLYCTSKWTVTGLSESLYDELKEFGIKVCCVEPGYFRSNLLNPSNKIVAANVIEDYEGDSAVRRGLALMEAANDNQPGDIKKGAQLIVDTLTEATGRPVPMRLTLGEDAYHYIGDKCRATLQLLEEWKDLTTKTDLDQK